MSQPEPKSKILTENYCLTLISRNRYKIDTFDFAFRREQAKQIPRCYYSGNQQSWVMPTDDICLEKFNEIIAKNRIKTKSQLKIEALKEYKEQLVLKRYSQNTITVYMEQINRFFKYYYNIEPNALNDDNVKEYLLHLLTTKNISLSYQKQVVSSIKFYFEKILGRETKKYYFDIPPNKRRKLPVVLTRKELLMFFDQITDLKSLALFKTIYSSGIRMSELINLKISDIDSEMMLINIRGGKGMKDRVTILSDDLLVLIKNYFKIYTPNIWLFESSKGTQYTPQAIRKKFHHAFDKTKIDKHATVHTLRHTFATHMLENGEDVRKIQKLLGHKNLNTTEIYTHISSSAIQNIKSPLDVLGIDKKGKKE